MDLKTRHDHRRPIAHILPWVAVIGLVMVRALPHVRFPYVFFDADQAMIGLMAKDLLAGRVLPWTFYGQKYLWAVEAWAAAGVFAVTGVSGGSLKIPLLFVNLGIASLLFCLLRREAKLSPWQACAATSVIAMPSALENAYMMAAQGGTAWPMLYVLIAWLLRERKVLLGLFLGAAYFHREFVIFGFVAMVILDFWSERREPRRRVVLSRVQSLCLAIITYHVLVGLGHLTSEFFGPGAPKTRLVALPQLLANLTTLMVDYLPTLLGIKPSPLSAYDLASTVSAAPTGWGWLNGLLLALLLVAVGAELWRQRSVLPQDKALLLPIYLILIALGQGAAYVLFIESSEPVLVRYLVMTPLALVGFLALAFHLGGVRSRWRLGGLSAMCALSFVLANTLQNGRMFLSHSIQIETDPRQVLAQYLVDHGYRYGWASYWDAYYLTFITDEKVMVAATDHTRMHRYKNLVAAQGQAAFVIANPGDCTDPNAPLIEGRLICSGASFRGEIEAMTKGR